MNGDGFPELHDETGLDGLKIEAIVDGGMATGDDAKILFRRGPAECDGDAEVGVKMEPGVILGFEIEVRMVWAAGEFGGVAVIVFAAGLAVWGCESGCLENESGSEG
jgi:hypothetical protein